MRQIDVLVPKEMKVAVRVKFVDGLASPKIVTTQDRLDRIPFVGSFLVRNIEPLGFSLGGDWSQLPDDINKVRWGIIEGGFMDQEVFNEVKQTLRSAFGDTEAKKKLEKHVSELLLPIAA